MKNAINLKIFGVLALLGAGLMLAGCKSVPELSKDSAQAMIQAKYDQTPPVGVHIVVNDQGMGEGVIAKYWTQTKRYPNGFWGDFALTPEGKKVVKLPNGGDVIQWHPTTVKDPNYNIIVVSVAANHLRARDLKTIDDATVPGFTNAKGVDFSEAVSLDGVPAPLQDIAHNPGNQLSVKHRAEFVLENGAWKLNSIE